MEREPGEIVAAQENPDEHTTNRTEDIKGDQEANREKSENSEVDSAGFETNDTVERLTETAVLGGGDADRSEAKRVTDASDGNSTDGGGDQARKDPSHKTSDQQMTAAKPQGIIEGEHDEAERTDTVENVSNDDNELFEFDTDLQNLISLDGPGRSKLFEKARNFEQKGKKDHALNYYLGCLTGLSASNQFPMLPQCLHQIADIYFEKEEYEKAVQFIQAEKLYYETALVDVTESKQKLKAEREKRSGDGKDVDSDAEREEVLKANEFEKLSRLCLQEGNTQLALEYCGKATKLCQAVYGEDHPKTIQSLDLFTVIYAEVGKKQYADAMKKFEMEESKMKDPKVGAAEKNGDGTEQESTLRYRGKEKGEKKDKIEENIADTQVEFEPTEPDEHHDDFVMTLLMMLAFFLVTVLAMFIVCYLYCSYADQSNTCASIKSEVTYFYMKLKYHYYYYFKSNQGNTYM